MELRLNQLFEMADKIMSWKSFYLFDKEEKFGTELDWKRILHGNPDSSAVLHFLKILISTGILIENGTVEINNKEYIRYKLCKNFDTKLLEEIIEISPEYLWLEKHYDIYIKGL